MGGAGRQVREGARYWETPLSEQVTRGSRMVVSIGPLELRLLTV